MWLHIIQSFFLCELCYGCSYCFRDSIYDKLSSDKDPGYWGIYGHHVTSGIARCIAYCHNLTSCLAISHENFDCMLLGSVTVNGPVWDSLDKSPVYMKRGVTMELPVFRISTGSKVSTYDSWENSVSAVPQGSFNLSAPLQGLYKHSFVEDWNNRLIKKVKLELYTGGHLSVKLLFDVKSDDDKMTWFKRTNLEESPWSDLNAGAATNYFSLKGQHAGRRVFINARYAGCARDIGWLVVTDSSGPCTWDSKSKYPTFQYVVGAAQNWNSGDIKQADDLVISLIFQP